MAPSETDFEAVEKFYGGKRIPEDEFFLNTLTRELSIPRDRVEHFSKVFLENLKLPASLLCSTTAFGGFAGWTGNLDSRNAG